MPEQDFYTSVWVHAANVKEVDNQQGFVECLNSVANKLIEDGLAQDPAVGGFDLLELEDLTSTLPKKPRGRPVKTDAPIIQESEPLIVETKVLIPEVTQPEPTQTYKTK